MDNTFAVIMAGGVGARFWPKSRHSIPKQYLSLFGKQSLIQNCVGRLRQLLPAEKIKIVTTRDQSRLLRSQLEWLQSSNIIFEPFGKNTAPCIGLAAMHLVHSDPDTVMMVLPADHLISDAEKFLRLLEHGVSLVREYPEALVTIGIQPSYPATGYGYIQKGDKVKSENGNAFQVRAFAEKPTLDIAEQFFSSGEFFWNSGIFIWRAQTILDNLEDLMPELYDGLCKIENAIGTSQMDQVTEIVYRQIHSESIDYGVMEHARQVMVLEGSFGWSDVGSWEAVYDISAKDGDGNVKRGNSVIKDVKNSYIEANGRAIAIVGVKDLVVVDTPDALLICNRKQTQEVKWVVEKLKHSGQEKYI